MREAELRVGTQMDRGGSNHALRTYARMTNDPVRFLWMCAHDWEGYRARVEILAGDGEQAAIDALIADFPEITVELAAGGIRRMQAQRQVMDWVGTPAMLCQEEGLRAFVESGTHTKERSWLWIVRLTVLFTFITGGLGGLALLADCGGN